MSTKTNNELWMKESTIFTMSNGSTVNGYRVSFVRMLEEGESLEDIDEGNELMELHGGSSGVTYTDENLVDLDEDEVVDENPSMDYEFYLE